MLDYFSAKEALTRSQKVLILPSQPVDGDCLGSALALYLVLKQLGKEATVVLTAEIPEIYKFLPEIEVVTTKAQVYSDFVINIDLDTVQLNQVSHEIVDNKLNIIVKTKSGTLEPDMIAFPAAKRQYDMLLIVDCAELSQLGEFYEQNRTIFSEVPSLNIDHHTSNTHYASLNFVDENASSTTELVYRILKDMAFEITPAIATLLLTGIITDTGSFQNDNTSPEAFEIASELVSLGANQQEIVRNVYKTKQLNVLKLWGKILSSIQVDPVNRLLYATVSQLDISETTTKYADIGDIIDELLANAEEADTVLLFSEKSHHTIYVSLRTKEGAQINAEQIAKAFNGGGHPHSAGFTLENTPLPTAIELVKAKILELQPTPISQDQKIEQLAKEFVSKPSNNSSI